MNESEIALFVAFDFYLLSITAACYTENHSSLFNP